MASGDIAYRWDILTDQVHWVGNIDGNPRRTRRQEPSIRPQLTIASTRGSADAPQGAQRSFQPRGPEAGPEARCGGARRWKRRAAIWSATLTNANTGSAMAGASSSGYTIAGARRWARTACRRPCRAVSGSSRRANRAGGPPRTRRQLRRADRSFQQDALREELDRTLSFSRRFAMPVPPSWWSASTSWR